jgi:hypothetical protein
MNEQEFWSAFKPAEARPVLYRLYHDDQGAPLFFSQEDLPGNYIDITHEEYVNPPKHFKVVNGSIELIETSVVRRLYPTDYGTPCHTKDISIVVHSNEPNIKWSMK